MGHALGSGTLTACRVWYIKLIRRIKRQSTTVQHVFCLCCKCSCSRKCSFPILGYSQCLLFIGLPCAYEVNPVFFVYVCVCVFGIYFPPVVLFCSRGLFVLQVMFPVIYCELVVVPSFLPWRVPLDSCRRPALISASNAFCVRAFFHVTKH